MEKVRPWCGQPSDRGRLKKRETQAFLHSSTDRTLTVPRTHNSFGDRSFAVAGPRLWIQDG